MSPKAIPTWGNFLTLKDHCIYIQCFTYWLSKIYSCQSFPGRSRLISAWAAKRMARAHAANSPCFDINIAENRAVSIYRSVSKQCIFLWVGKKQKGKKTQSTPNDITPPPSRQRLIPDQLSNHPIHCLNWTEIGQHPTMQSREWIKSITISGSSNSLAKVFVGKLLKSKG